MQGVASVALKRGGQRLVFRRRSLSFTPMTSRVKRYELRTDPPPLLEGIERVNVFVR